MAANACVLVPPDAGEEAQAPRRRYRAQEAQGDVCHLRSHASTLLNTVITGMHQLRSHLSACVCRVGQDTHILRVVIFRIFSETPLSSLEPAVDSSIISNPFFQAW